MPDQNQTLSERDRIYEWLNENPEALASIDRGMHESHLRHTFSWWLVKHEFEGWIGLQLYCRAIVKLKKYWWWLKTPYQNFQHRNCLKCKEFKSLKRSK